MNILLSILIWIGCGINTITGIALITYANDFSNTYHVSEKPFIVGGVFIIISSVSLLFLHFIL